MLDKRQSALGQEDTRNAQLVFRPGIYYGLVESTDDPKIRGRIKVRVYPFQRDKDNIPTKTLPWAQVMGSHSGNPDQGVFEIPKVGAQVLVAFVQGDPDRPIVLGGAYAAPDGESEVPDEVKEATDDVKVHVLGKTPKKHRVILNDNDDQLEILIKSSEGHEQIILIDDLNRRILIQTTYGHSILLDDPEKAILIETGAGHRFLMNDPYRTIELRTIGGYTFELSDTLDTIRGRSPDVTQWFQLKAGARLFEYQDITMSMFLKYDGGTQRISLQTGTDPMASAVFQPSDGITLQATNDINIISETTVTIHGGMSVGLSTDTWPMQDPPAPSVWFLGPNGPTELNTHKHTDVTVGTSDTGAPTP